MTEIAVAVRDLVAFCHRSGDIDHRFTPSPTGQQGVEGHQRLYRRRPDSYRREHPVAFRHCQGDITLLLRGRADGYDPERGLVEEIKTCRVSVQRIPEAVTRQHLAQARLYGAMIAAEEGLEELEVQLTWFNIDSDEEHRVNQHYTAQELAGFLQESLARFASWLAMLAGQRRERDLSLEQLAFPHAEFRPGQRDIAELVYKCVDQGGQLLLEAPTGIGKTAAVLYPALKALGRGKHDGLVFVTARNVGRRAAEECLGLLREGGMQLSALSLTAKERICFSPGRACHGEDCEFARGYYDRLPQALETAAARPTLDRPAIEDIARNHRVCPYQLAQDLLPWVSLVIADQHYVYSLSARPGGPAGEEGGRWTALLDEAHNLPERARDMYSARLSKASLMAVRRDMTGSVKRALERVNRVLLALQGEEWQESDRDCRQQLPDKLLLALQAVVSTVGEELARDPGFLQRHPALVDFYFEVQQWLRVAQHWGDDYRLLLSRGRGRQSLQVSLYCLDPTRLLQERQQGLHAVTAFSATLSPAHWMRGLLGLGEDSVCRRVESPFAAEQLRVCLATDVDTRYRQREASMPLLANRVAHWLKAQPGNCIVYFPSYRYLQDCLELVGDPPGRYCWVQAPDQPDGEREALLQLLETRRDVAAFCILGGVFGEGVDLPGDRLASVVVVGVGLPQVNRDRELLRDWYQGQHGVGFEYAYLYPGLQKVNQALGRVVRTDRDRGTALLLDSRYQRREYRQLLAPWWHYQQGES